MADTSHNRGLKIKGFLTKLMLVGFSITAYPVVCYSSFKRNILLFIIIIDKALHLPLCLGT